MHMPQTIFNEFISIYAVPGYTCDMSDHSNPVNQGVIYGYQLPTFKCSCSGSNFNGMPALEICANGKHIFTQAPYDYMYNATIDMFTNV